MDNRTTIVLDKKYEPGLLRMEKQAEIWVLWWFDRNDTPEKRSILQVHPQGNPDNPLTGVFATHSPVRPNLIAMTRCKIISVKDNVIEIEGIDAFPARRSWTSRVNEVSIRPSFASFGRRPPGQRQTGSAG